MGLLGSSAVRDSEAITLPPSCILMWAYIVNILLYWCELVFVGVGLYIIFTFPSFYPPDDVAELRPGV